MDIITFLNRVVPNEGIRFITEWVLKASHPRGGAMLHHPTESTEELAAQAAASSAKGRNTYFSLASFKEVQYKTIKTAAGGDFTFPTGRTQTNVAAVKSLWVDLDVGKAGDSPSYATRDDALADLKRYLRATGMPLPLLVSSGYGLHAYWTFDRAVPPETWLRLASKQRTAMKHLGIKIDPSRDLDCASVLRPIGTFNYKAGQPAKLVKAVLDGDPKTFGEYDLILSAYLDKNNLAPAKTTINYEPKGEITENEFGGDDFPTSHADEIVKHCSQLRKFSQDGGATEPMWYAAIGVVKHCDDGIRKSHEWSANHSGYDAAQCQAKLEQWEFGPTTCTKFQELNADGCLSCGHKVKSPIQLGLRPETKAPEIVLPVALDEPQDDPKAVEGWPERFSYNPKTEQIYTTIENEEGINERVPVASPLFYPIETQILEDGTASLRMRMHVRAGEVREFNIATKHLGDERALRGVMSAYQIHVHNSKLAVTYMSDFMTALRRLRSEVNTYTQFGWTEDLSGFLIGNQLITADKVTPVLLSKKVNEKLHNIYEAKGDPNQWIDAVDAIYNRPNGEPYQFVIAAAFGAVLNRHLNFSEWKGIPVAITSDASGYGKTTVTKMALNIYCASDRTAVADTTPKAILGRVSPMNNIPMLFDEMTTPLSDPDRAVEVFYALSNGQSRIGMTSDGKERDALPGWNITTFMTGNKNFMSLLRGAKVNPEASQLRVFEIDLCSYPRIATMNRIHSDYKRYNAEHAALARNIISDNYGAIGTEWLQFIMRNQQTVTEMLARVSGSMQGLMGGDATKERYYAHLLTCTLVGAYFAKKLGYIKFNLNALRDWAVKHIERLRETIEEDNDSNEDIVAQMISAMEPGILRTNRFHSYDARSTNHNAMIMLDPKPRGEVVGRYITGLDASGNRKEPARMYLSTKAMQEWCAAAGLQWNVVKREALASGLFVNNEQTKSGSHRFAFGKGVSGYTLLPIVGCFEVNQAFAENILEGSPEGDNVVPIKAA